ncbi:DNA-directed DNA polymerase [Tanacetum coccineum]
MSRFTRDAITVTLVTGLYLTRRSLEVLRKFHWTILGGRFNQLSHVSSPLLSKPGEYYFGMIEIHGSNIFRGRMGKKIIMEYLVNISKRRAFWSLNEDILKINDSDNQYAVSIKEDTAYPCLHSPKTTKERRSIHRAASGLHPYHFTHPERKLTMEEMLYKFIDEGKREYEEMRAFILINNTPMIDCEVKGVTTRGGKTTTQDARNNDTNVHTEEPLAVNHDELVESNEVLTHDQPQKTNEPNAQPSDKIQMPPYPFLEDGGSKKKRLSRISLLTNKARLEEACTITMNERCSAILLNKLPSKEKDPRSFTIPCDIGQLHINNALADLGASISLMPYTMYENLGLGEPKATRMSLELADRSIQNPRGIIENVLIEVDKFVLPIYFVILDMPKDSRVPIILGRPFLATARAMIDVFNKKIMLREPDSFLSRGLEKSIDQSDLEGYEPVECKTDNDSNLDKPIRRIASKNTSYPVVQETTKPVEVEREHRYVASDNEIDEKKPELKDFPHHLEYAYLNVLEKRKGAIAWKMSDIKGISPSYCIHNILMEDDFKLLIQPQRRLNLKVQDVVKNEIVKLFDSRLIYPISDSSWVSPIYVVPKKGGITVVLNDNNELIPSRTVTRWRVCIDYCKLKDATQKDHFPLPFIDQIPIRRIHQGRYGVSVPALTKDHKRNEDQYAVSRGLNTPYSRYGINIIFWKISNVVPTPRNPQYADGRSKPYYGKKYIRLEEEKAHKSGKVFNWQTATYGKIRVDDDLHNLSSVEAVFPAIVINVETLIVGFIDRFAHLGYHNIDHAAE